MPDSPTRLHAFVSGMVQGVGFRYFVVDAAHDVAAVGWVRNLRDGRVEVVAEGPRPTLETLLAMLRQGPRASRVDEVNVEWETARNEFVRFGLERTA